MKDQRKEVEGIDESTYAGKAVKACRLKARGIFGDELLTFHLLDFVSFLAINNKFLSKGFYITDENREEMYIKVIETGDNQLISDLETFINLRDSIKILETKRNEFNDIVNGLRNLPDYNDTDKVNKIVENYLRK